MKKYSLVLILILCLFTITGGVYSAWQYYEDKVIANESVTVGPSIDISTSSNAKGTITNGANSITLKVEPKTSGSYEAKLVADGSVTFTFNDADSNDAYTLSSWDWWITVTGNDNGVFSSIDEGKTNVTNGDPLKITGAMVASKLTFGTHTLNSHALATQFGKFLEAITITIHVDEHKA